MRTSVLTVTLLALSAQPLLAQGYDPILFGAIKWRIHSLKVKVRRSGLRVRTRAGFYGVTDETVAKAAPPAIP